METNRVYNYENAVRNDVEERRFEEECRRGRIAYERERRRRQTYNRNNIVRVRIM